MSLVAWRAIALCVLVLLVGKMAVDLLHMSQRGSLEDRLTTAHIAQSRAEGKLRKAEASILAGVQDNARLARELTVAESALRVLQPPEVRVVRQRTAVTVVDSADVPALRLQLATVAAERDTAVADAMAAEARERVLYQHCDSMATLARRALEQESERLVEIGTHVAGASEAVEVAQQATKRSRLSRTFSVIKRGTVQMVIAVVAFKLGQGA